MTESLDSTETDRAVIEGEYTHSLGHRLGADEMKSDQPWRLVVRVHRRERCFATSSGRGEDALLLPTTG